MPVQPVSALASIDLTVPPRVAGIGHGLHGVGRDVDDFVLAQLWSLHLYGYAADLEVDGVRHAIVPGSVSLVPPATRIRYRYRGPSRHVYAHVEAAALGPLPVGLGVMVSPGPDLPHVTDLMESAVASAASRPARTQADIWMALLRLADRQAAQASPAYGTEAAAGGPSAAAAYVATAMAVVEARLTERLTVPQIAREVGVSPDHLTRVFSAETGRTVVGYVRHRRIEHAQRLLAHTTMSVSAIAATVGIPDLQAFNKTCRAVTGRSPRQLRAGAPAP